MSQNKQNMKRLPINNGYRIVKEGNTIFKTPMNIFSTENTLDFCQKCSSKMEDYHTLIPLGNGNAAEIPGKWCRKCDALYVSSSLSIEELLKDNIHAKGFTYNNNKILWNYTNEQKRLMRERIKKEKRKQKHNERLVKIAKTPSSEVMICIKNEDDTFFDYIIASNKLECDNKEVFHYSTEIGRELISAAFAEQRNKSGTLFEKNYSVIRCIYPDANKRSLSEKIVLTELKIQPNGGYYTSARGRNNLEVVDTLLYSLCTNRYEIIRATYNKTLSYSFVDIQLFRNYVIDYGRPELSPVFSFKQVKSTESFDNLKTESILRMYGYNVSQDNGLSSGKRQTLLAEIVDLEILPINKIVSFLNFFIKTHTDDKYYYARNKWESDMQFIQNYRVNPERFLIGKFNKKLV